MNRTNNLKVVCYNASLQKLALSFRSGNDYLDQFLRQEISLDDNYGKTEVLISEDNEEIIGYYNLGLGYVEQEEYGIVKKIGGAVHINNFALAEKYHGVVQTYTEQGIRINLSDILLDECMQKIEEIRKKYIGFAFVTLASTREGYHLYERNGFEKLDDDMSFSREESEVECIPMYFSFLLKNTME